LPTIIAGNQVTENKNIYQKFPVKNAIAKGHKKIIAGIIIIGIDQIKSFMFLFFIIIRK
jgi:hypothetical protein